MCQGNNEQRLCSHNVTDLLREFQERHAMPRPPQLQPQQRNFADIDPEAPQPLILHEQPEYIFCLDVVTKTVEWLVENCDAGVDPDDLVTLLGSLDPGAALPKLLLHAGVWAPMYFNSVTFFDATITVFCAGVSKWVDGLVRAEVLNHDGVRGWETAFRALKDDFARLRDWVRDYLWKTERWNVVRQMYLNSGGVFPPPANPSPYHQRLLDELQSLGPRRHHSPQRPLQQQQQQQHKQCRPPASRPPAPAPASQTTVPLAITPEDIARRAERPSSLAYSFVTHAQRSRLDIEDLARQSAGMQHARDSVLMKDAWEQTQQSRRRGR